MPDAIAWLIDELKSSSVYGFCDVAPGIESENDDFDVFFPILSL